METFKNYLKSINEEHINEDFFDDCKEFPVGEKPFTASVVAHYCGKKALTVKWKKVTNYTDGKSFKLVNTRWDGYAWPSIAVVVYNKTKKFIYVAINNNFETGLGNTFGWAERRFSNILAVKLPKKTAFDVAMKQAIADKDELFVYMADCNYREFVKI